MSSVPNLHNSKKIWLGILTARAPIPQKIECAKNQSDSRILL